MEDKINIAIDGYSSCGKSTLAKDLAARLSYKYIDSGAMYRAITLFAIEQKLIDQELHEKELINRLPLIEIDFNVDMETGKGEVILNGESVEGKIRNPGITEWVSDIAAIPEVRTKLVSIQQKIGEDKGVVMDGRDIGTVVFPKAELKVFVTADIEVRSKRRWMELQERGIYVDLESVRKNLEKRDEIDSNRETSPLKRAEGSFLLDTTSLNQAEQLEQVMRWFYKKIRN